MKIITGTHRWDGHSYMALGQDVKHPASLSPAEKIQLITECGITISGLLQAVINKLCGGCTGNTGYQLWDTREVEKAVLKYIEEMGIDVIGFHILQAKGKFLGDISLRQYIEAQQCR